MASATSKSEILLVSPGFAISTLSLRKTIWQPLSRVKLGSAFALDWETHGVEFIAQASPSCKKTRVADSGPTAPGPRFDLRQVDVAHQHRQGHYPYGEQWYRGCRRTPRPSGNFTGRARRASAAEAAEEILKWADLRHA